MSTHNREGAINAKETALMMMKNNDFVSAKDMLLKAQRLLPELENLTQLLNICNVHCAAERSSNNDMDWYSILGVELQEDGQIIKKKFQKLAILLHPDKNKFAGGEAAFKLVAEARSILCDPMKRSKYDKKRKNGFNNVPSKGNPTSRKSANTCSMSNRSTGHTFWTTCPKCYARHQYRICALNKMVCCQNCDAIFSATRQVSPNKKHDNPYKHSNTQAPSSESGRIDTQSRMNVSLQHAEYVKGMRQKEVDDNVNKVKTSRGLPTMKQYESSSAIKKGNLHGRGISDIAKRSLVDVQNLGAECAFAMPSATITFGDGISKAKKNNGGPTNPKVLCINEMPRMHTVPMYADSSVMDNDVDVTLIQLKSSSRKRQRKNESLANVQRGTNISTLQGKGKTTARASSDNIVVECTVPVSEMLSFYSECYSIRNTGLKVRDINKMCKAVGQIWALYDNLDGMPRSYAQVKHINRSKWTVHLNWLEYIPRDEETKHWKDEELPVACGNFRLGKKWCKLEYNSEQFSHVVEWIYDENKNLYIIHPVKEEVWAIYKEWSMNWYSDGANHRTYEYEVVEVLSDMSVTDGCTVLPLVRIEGFLCLFAAAKDKSRFDMKLSELLRFSHKIPFYKTTGDERRLYKDAPLSSKNIDLPGGFLQLDTLCLPTDWNVAFCSITLDSYMSISRKTSRICVTSTTDSTGSKIDTSHDKFAQKENHAKLQRHDNSRQLLGSSPLVEIASKRHLDIIPNAHISESNASLFPLCMPLARNHSPNSQSHLSGHSTIPPNESILHTTMDQGMLSNVVLPEHNVGHMAQENMDSSYNIQLEEIHMNNNTRPENRNTMHSKSGASKALFVKTLNLWSEIDANEVFKELPQQPHFHPLQQLQLEEREATALVLTRSFIHLVESIKKSSLEDSKKSFEEKLSTLCNLEEHGFNFAYFRVALTKMLQVKEDYTSYLKEKEVVNAQELEGINSLSKMVSLLSEKQKAVAEKQHKLDQLLKQKKGY